MTPERYNKLNSLLEKRQLDLTVVMENIEDPRNIAAVMRTCDAVGVQDLYILNYARPHRERWKFKAARGAAKWLTIHQLDNVEACVNILKKQSFHIYTTRFSATAKSIYDINLTSRIALVFGNEADGVSEALAGYADGNFLVPQVGMIPSLNISVACAVSLYEAYRQKSMAGHYSRASLSAERIAQLKKIWEAEDDL